MTATNQRSRMPLTSRATGPARSRQRSLRRHDNAVIQAEVRRLARALVPHRALQRESLADLYEVPDASAPGAP
jgi:hypothetical protein